MKPQRKPIQFVSSHLEVEAQLRENPDWRVAHDGEKAFPRKAMAAVNIRESGISLLSSKGALNEAQVAAADKFRRLFEAMGSSGARAIDFTREAVDGGRSPDPIGDAALDSGKKLAEAHKVVVRHHGLYAWRLLEYICGEGRSIHQLTQTRRQRDTMTDNLRAYLDCLAEHWLLQTRSRLTSRA